MALALDQLERLCMLVSSGANLREVAKEWRENEAPEAQVRAMVLDAMDMRDETPWRQVGPCAMYLVSTDGHCWQVTSNVEAANAVVLAQG